MSRISDEELRRLLAVSEGANFPLAFRAAGQLGEISPELAFEVLQLREALQFYAETDHWSATWNQQDGMTWARAEDDRGSIARAALSTSSPVVAKEGRDA